MKILKQNTRIIFEKKEYSKVNDRLLKLEKDFK